MVPKAVRADMLEPAVPLKEEPKLSNPELWTRFDGDCGNESAVLVSSLADLSLTSAWREHPVLKVKVSST